MSAFTHKLMTACLAGWLAVLPAAAQDGGDRLQGTLKAIRDRGAVRIGYRASSAPFSSVDAQGRPAGYSLDLCNALVEDIADELGGIELRTELRPVTPENRFTMVVSGAIDIECGSTTNTPERQQRVAFSPPIFITGTKLLVRRDAQLRSLADLAGRPVAVTRDTSNAAAVEQLSQRRGLGLVLLGSAEHDASMALLAAGKADAFASDEVLLYTQMAESRSNPYRVVGEFLSYEPYGLMFRRDDPAFAAVVERGFRRLATSREIVWIYDKWFLKRLPSGLRLGLPMSPQLEESLRILGLPS
jgi:glutamate/aspartate transport system substrate-binding protein